MADTPDIHSENSGNGADEAEALGGAPIMIGAQYIKDLSFENPRGVETLSAIQQNPDVSVDISTNARGIGENMYEVTLFVRCEASVDDSPVFIVELTYAGLVSVGGVSEEEVKPIVLIEGPRHLFPFARAIVSNTVRDGGFPPLLINPIDFAALYINQHVDTESDNADI